MGFLNRTFSEKTLSQMIINDYFEVFKYYKYNDMQQAVYQCIEDCRFFPKPNEILTRLKLKTKKHDKEFIQHWRCPVCKAEVACIIEGKCRYCNAKLPLNIPRPKYKQKFTDIPGFDIGYGIKCEKCGQIGTCIHELPEDYWQCRECYSGLNNDEFKQKMHDIVESIDNKGL